MAIDKEFLKKMFPNLYRELESGDCKIQIDALRKNPQEVESEDEDDGVEFEGQESAENESCTEMPDKLRHFNPSAQDFIRRCDTKEQAEEIIAYLQRKGEITKEEAEKLQSQLRRGGVRSFGPKKEDYFYFKEGGIF